MVAPGYASSFGLDFYPPHKDRRASSPCKAAQGPGKAPPHSRDLGLGASLFLSVLLSIVLQCYEL